MYFVNDEHNDHCLFWSESIITIFWNLWSSNTTLYDPSNFIGNEDGNADVDDTFDSFERKKLRSKSVRFSHVEIREHEVVLGDPTTSKMYPLSLGWGHSETKMIDLDEHIESRSIKSICRRNKNPTLVDSRILFRLRTYERFERLAIVGGHQLTDLYRMEKQRNDHRYCGDNIML